MNITDALTFVIPFRADSKERTENLQTVVSYLESLKCKILIMEADEEAHLDVSNFCSTTTYIFRTDRQKFFHRTKYINEMLRMASTCLVGVWDSDVILFPQQIQQACDAILESKAVIAYPYNGEFIEIPAMLSRRIRESHDVSNLVHYKRPSAMGRPSCGGAFIVNREQYLSIGGENERFVGWGPEDAERLHRCKILGLGALWLQEGALYHLYHPHTEPQDESTMERLTFMREEFVKECNMDSITLRNYLNGLLH